MLIYGNFRISGIKTIAVLTNQNAKTRTRIKIISSANLLMKL
jgi:hypothetical protein